MAAAQAAQTEAEAKVAAAQAAQTEALTELAIAQTKILRLSSDIHIVAEDHTAPGVDSGSSAPMDIVAEDHTGRGAHLVISTAVCLTVVFVVDAHEW